MARKKTPDLDIRVDVYHQNIQVFYSLDTFKRWLSTFSNNFEHPDIGWEGVYARIHNVETEEFFRCIVFNDMQAPFNSISHEATHAAMDILDDVGFPSITTQNWEALTYLQAYIAEAIFLDYLPRTKVASDG